VSTAVPVNVLMLPNAMLPMLTVHVCAKECEDELSNTPIIQVARTIFCKYKSPLRQYGTTENCIRH